MASPGTWKEGGPEPKQGRQMPARGVPALVASFLRRTSALLRRAWHTAARHRDFIARAWLQWKARRPARQFRVRERGEHVVPPGAVDEQVVASVSFGHEPEAA